MIASLDPLGGCILDRPKKILRGEQCAMAKGKWGWGKSKRGTSKGKWGWAWLNWCEEYSYVLQYYPVTDYPVLASQTTRTPFLIPCVPPNRGRHLNIRLNRGRRY